jgi:hypothetical protein
MGLFNYIDTFFFISLGITFILILLLVFHFKQRISTLEQKNETMFEIINNIVQELVQIKYIITPPPVENIVPPSSLQPSLQPSSLQSSSLHLIHNHSLPMNNIIHFDNNKIVVSDDEEEDSDDDEDDSDDDEDDSAIEDDSDDDEENKIKVINVALNDNIQLNEVDDIIEAEPSQGNIIVEKMNTNESEIDNSDIQKEVKKEIYRKMTLSALKSIVIEKGLLSDPSKLKKQELLKLLETNLDE